MVEPKNDKRKHVPFRNVARPVARSLELIEDLSSFASIPSRKVTVDANEKELTILRIGVTGMLQRIRLVHSRTTERKHI